MKQSHPSQSDAPHFYTLVEYFAKVETDVHIKTVGMISL